MYVYSKGPNKFVDGKKKISDLSDTAIEERSNLFGFLGSVNGKPRGEMVDALQNHHRCG